MIDLASLFNGNFVFAKKKKKKDKSVDTVDSAINFNSQVSKMAYKFKRKSLKNH